MDKEQAEICRRYGAAFAPLVMADKVGISSGALHGEMPLHGLRHGPENGTTGWFIWANEYSQDDDFFKALHALHLKEFCPAVLPYLGLPPGWRFLIAPGHEDVWSDDSLLIG